MYICIIYMYISIHIIPNIFILLRAKYWAGTSRAVTLMYIWQHLQIALWQTCKMLWHSSVDITSTRSSWVTRRDAATHISLLVMISSSRSHQLYGRLAMLFHQMLEMWRAILALDWVWQQHKDERQNLIYMKYIQHARVKDKYNMIFRHEHMSLIVLNKASLQLVSKDKYIPAAVEKREMCHCGEEVAAPESSHCAFCWTNLHGLLEENFKHSILFKLKISPYIMKQTKRTNKI